VAAFSELIEMYFEDAFLLEWQRIEPLLAASAADARRRIADDGLPDALPHLAPRLRSSLMRARPPWHVFSACARVVGPPRGCAGR
jgi:hypothetical protein